MDIETIKKILVEEDDLIQNKDIGILRFKLKKIEELKDLPHIIIISGLRRAGKSTLLNQINKKYYNNLKFSYLNFENEKLFNFDIKEFDKIYQSFLELNEENNVFFLDEIQNLENWEIPIRRLYEKNIKFFITGSNASLLSKELGTKLTGRHINIELFPFSFREFLDFKNLKFKKNELYLTKNIAKINNLFNEYLLKGGIPEYLKYKNKEIISNIYNDILYKDILVRYNISNEKSLKELSKYLFSNIGKKFSYNKLKSILNLGSVNTVKSYINYLENSYLLFQLEKYDSSIKKQILNPKKIYSIDPSFIENISFKFSEDRGRLLENLVFIELKRQGKEIYYHFEKKECDFVIKEGLEIVQAIQVTKSLDGIETKKREIEGLIDACKTHKLKSGLILTEDEEGKEIRDVRFENGEKSEIKIKILPIWKWLLIENQQATKN